MESNTVFDTVETENMVHVGVIDYVSKRQIIMYDLTNSLSPEFRLAVIEWKMSYFTMRFAIFMKLYYPKVSIPKPIVISINSIHYCSKQLKSTKPRKNKIRAASTKAEDLEDF